MRPLAEYSDQSDEKAAPLSKPTLTFPDGIGSCATQYQKRRALLTGPDLPPLDMDFHPLKDMPLPAQDLPRPEGLTRVAKKRHMLLGELQGHCELTLLHGLLVSHLRKHTYPETAPALFLRLWSEENAWLLENLPTRWLIAAVITFAECGQTEADRSLAGRMNILFSLMKIYEAERAFSGHPPQKPFKIKDRNKSPLPMGMKDFSVLGGDLEANLLVPLWRDAAYAPATGTLVRHLLDILNQDDGTVFRRFALMRDSASRLG